MIIILIVVIDNVNNSNKFTNREYPDSAWMWENK